jgi:RsiW-degrading membrane proteinase PrsW (M82 family)
VFAALVPAVVLCIYVYKHDKVEKEPVWLLLLLLVLGALSCFPVGEAEGFVIGKSSIELILHDGYTVTSAIGTQNGKTLGELFVKEKNQIRSDTVSFMDGDVDIRVITEPKG